MSAEIRIDVGPVLDGATENQRLDALQMLRDVVGHARLRALVEDLAVERAGLHGRRVGWWSPRLERLSPQRAREVVTPWAGPLGALMPDVVALLRRDGVHRAGPELEAVRAQEAVVSVILRIAALTPVLLVVEDADAADAGTTGALHLIASRLRRNPAGAEHLLLLVTARDGEDDQVQAALAEVADHVPLGPLREADVEELARRLGVPGIASQVYETTRGHTLLASEMLREASRHLPRSVRLQLSEAVYDLVLRGLRRAGAEVEQLLRVAAVLPESFDLDVLAELAEAPPERATRGVERALGMGLIHSTGSRLEFANPVFRSVLLDTTPEPVIVSRRRRAAHILSLPHSQCGRRTPRRRLGTDHIDLYHWTSSTPTTSA